MEYNNQETSLPKEVIWKADSYVLGVKVPEYRYELGEKSLVIHSGVLSKKTEVVPLYTIERMESEVGAISKFFHCGQVKIYLRSRRDTVYVLRVKNPGEVLDIIARQQLAEKKEFTKRRKNENRRN